MKMTLLRFILMGCFLSISAQMVYAQHPHKISHLVVFGDSLSDNGINYGGGFGRNSNGFVWAEYVAQQLCKTCYESYAWAGATTDVGNYSGLDWSGVLWQVKEYQPKSSPDKTLYVLWAGTNDFLLGKGEPQTTVAHLLSAAQTLIDKGATHIAFINLFDVTQTPAFNNKTLAEYKNTSKRKDLIKKDIDAHNQLLTIQVNEKQKALQASHSKVNLVMIDMSQFVQDTMAKEKYQNTTDPWAGTFTYPSPRGYFWWDSVHPMTSVHQLIAQSITNKLEEAHYRFVD